MLPGPGEADFELAALEEAEPPFDLSPSFGWVLKKEFQRVF